MSLYYDEELPAGFQDADLLQAQYEAEGAAYAARQRESDRLRASGDVDAAARKCPHGSGYPLASPAATHSDDPFAGEEGVRCTECGSRLSDFAWDGGTVLVPCEVPVR
jgi:hypothetical protein